MNIISKNKGSFFDGSVFSIGVSNVTFGYQKECWILNDITCELKTGCIYAVLGESGAGKTTFIDVVLGLLQPNHGHISVNAENEKVSIKSK